MLLNTFYVIFGTLILSSLAVMTEGGRLNKHQNSSLDYPILAITDFPLGISEVFDDAKEVFRKVVGKMIAKKRLVGLDSGWYW